MYQAFATPHPVDLYVELGAGRLTVHAEDVAETTVSVEGREAESVSIQQHGTQVLVLAPKRWTDLLGSFKDLAVTVTVPTGSSLATKLGAADMVATGSIGGARLRSSSGDVHAQAFTGHTVVETASGDVELGDVLGDLRVRAASGDVRLGRGAGTVAVVTASGDVLIGTAEREAVLRTASGEVHVADAQADVRTTTASGDIVIAAVRRGVVNAKTASGDVRVGVPRGVPVWTDVSSVSGTISSTLEGAGQPAEGQDHIEARINTVSGRIHLEQLA